MAQVIVYVDTPNNRYVVHTDVRRDKIVQRGLKPPSIEVPMAQQARNQVTRMQDALATAAEWDESSHPRDEKGRFGGGGDAEQARQRAEIDKHAATLETTRARIKENAEREKLGERLSKMFPYRVSKEQVDKMSIKELKEAIEKHAGPDHIGKPDDKAENRAFVEKRLKEAGLPNTKEGRIQLRDMFRSGLKLFNK